MKRVKNELKLSYPKAFQCDDVSTELSQPCNTAFKKQKHLFTNKRL